MDAREYAEWHRANVLHRRSAAAEWADARREERAAKAPPTQEEREERAATVRGSLARILCGLLKGLAFVFAALFAAVFGSAMKENPPRDNRM